MNITNFLIGPQLIGIIFFIIGVITQRFPPKHINSLYGYRTSSSMKNQQTWDEANRFSARWMTGCGIVLFIIGIALMLIVNTFVPSAKIRGEILAASLLISGIVPAILTLVVTEKHLNKNFNNEDEVR